MNYVVAPRCEVSLTSWSRSRGARQSGTDALTTYAVKVSDGYTSTTVPVSFTKRANDPVPVPLLLINQLLALIAMISLMLGWRFSRLVGRSR